MKSHLIMFIPFEDNSMSNKYQRKVTECRQGLKVQGEKAGDLEHYISPAIQGGWSKGKNKIYRW